MVKASSSPVTCQWKKTDAVRAVFSHFPVGLLSRYRATLIYIKTFESLQDCFVHGHPEFLPWPISGAWAENNKMAVSSQCLRAGFGLSMAFGRFWIAIMTQKWQGCRPENHICEALWHISDNEALYPLRSLALIYTSQIAIKFLIYSDPAKWQFLT